MDWRGYLETWQRSLQARAEGASTRLAARRDVLAVAVLLSGFFLIASGLRISVAFVALAAVGAWAAFSPLAGIDDGPAAQVADGKRPRRALWNQVVDGFPEAAVVLGPAGHVVHMNRIAEELLGTGRVGLHFTAFSRDPALITAIDEALERGVATSVELQERVPVQRRRSATVAPLGHIDTGSGDPALLLTVRDLTEQDRLARMRADFVANASHELRTPLAALKGFVETLQGAAKDDPAARDRFLQVMSDQADRMTRLIDDLLSLSRVEMREHLPPSERVDLDEALSDVVQALQPLAERSGIALHMAPAPDGPVVRGDRDELLQVFQNLIQNALKYGRSGGHVDVSVSRKGSRILVAVQDDGPGIPPQHLPRLTERFYRISVAASRERGGTGLGLAIVKHILNRHRGELQIASEVGKGSTFTVSLPALEGSGK